MCSAIFIWGLMLQLVLYAHTDALVTTDEMTLHHITDRDIVLSGRTDEFSVKFYPLAVLGGFLWATGNTMSVPVRDCIPG